MWHVAIIISYLLNNNNKTHRLDCVHDVEIDLSWVVRESTKSRYKKNLDTRSWEEL